MERTLLQQHQGSLRAARGRCLAYSRHDARGGGVHLNPKQSPFPHAHERTSFGSAPWHRPWVVTALPHQKVRLAAGVRQAFKAALTVGPPHPSLVGCPSCILSCATYDELVKALTAQTRAGDRQRDEAALQICKYIRHRYVKKPVLRTRSSVNWKHIKSAASRCTYTELCRQRIAEIGNYQRLTAIHEHHKQAPQLHP
jgi:hypothetical protein